MSYPSVVAAALSGASVRQLSYWRSARSTEPLLAPEFRRSARRIDYSFRDVVALRAFVYLRSRDVPLQRVRKAVRALREMGETEHLATYTLVAVGRDVVWRRSADEVVDLTGNAGQYVIAQMADILDSFQTSGREVVPLHTPKPGVTIDPDVRGGYPVLAGTRVPYDVVASLVSDGVQPGDISQFYPSVTAGDAVGAQEFAAYVDKYRARAAG